MSSSVATTTRLHITPFNPELLPLVLPVSVRPSATEISFHSIPTFPENNYGYVTLPTMEADKIRKKLNGSILKGRKFKVEPARPQKRHTDNDGEDSTANHKSLPTENTKKQKKRKAEENILDGYELPPDRKVKRGWTESANDKVERRKKEKKNKSEGKTKSQSKSKYTEKEECLFRTKVPANKLLVGDEKSGKQSKKKNKSSQESVVHEFSQTISHPSFLRSEDGSTPVTSIFEEGKGWVDESGNLKEQISDRIRKQKFQPGQVAGYKERLRQVTLPKAKNLSSEKSKSQRNEADKDIESIDESEDWTSSSGSSSSDDTISDSDSNESVSSDSSERSELYSNREGPTTPNYKAIASKEDPEKESNPQPSEVHPLEALFKRPAPTSSETKPDLEAPTQFSFFGRDAESEEDIDEAAKRGGESEEEEEENVDEERTSKVTEPLTPFTKRDLQSRGLRSAAPTPDTSQVGRTINWNLQSHLDFPGAEDSSPAPKGTGLNEDSEFTKWFWENRGDNNRAWKRRRRDVAKEQRQRENRTKGMKGKS